MRHLVGMLLIAGMAGCLGVDEAPPVPFRAPCEFALPDGAPVDCASNRIVAPAAIVPDGFLCTAQHEMEETGGHQRTWAHRDGRVGVSWSWLDHVPPGLGVVSASMTEDGRERVVADAAFTPQGFLELPARPDGRYAEVAVWMRFFTLEGPDIQQATLHVGEHAGHAWYWWEVRTSTDTLWFDLMQEDHDDGITSLDWFPAEQQAGPYNMSQWAKGVKYKPGAAHVSGLANRWCPDPLGLGGPLGRDRADDDAEAGLVAFARPFRP